MSPYYRTEQALLEAKLLPPGRSAVWVMGDGMGDSARLADSVPEILRRSIGEISCISLATSASL